MERLVIDNFLILNHVDFEIKKFNIIIGSQGGGKSLIAKIIYFFKTIGAELETGITKGSDVSDLEDTILEKFGKIFPSYSWKDTDFSISYYVDELKILIQHDRNTKSLSLVLPEEAVNEYIGLVRKSIEIKDRLNRKRDSDLDLSLKSLFGIRYSVRKLMRESPYNKLFQHDKSRFIPASRAFFSVINENFFTMLSSNQRLDPLLIEFGETYEAIKGFYNHHISSDKGKESQTSINECIKEISRIILNGEYQLKDEKEWIVNGNSKVELMHASSGQQEALPLLIILAVLQNIGGDNSITFIEEPEAHLFPLSQGYIMSVISMLYSQNKAFFITTHSPYILSELNNFIYAAELCEKGKLTQKMFEDLNLFGCPIKFDDVSAYTIENGSLKSILDKDYKLINSDELDKASDHAEKVFSKLITFDVE